MAPSAVAVEASTITPDHARALGAAATERSLGFAEAPVVGSRPQADAGALVSLVGATDADLARIQPVLETYSGAIRHTGPVGTAATMKLAINGLFAMQVAAFAEIVGLLELSLIHI